MSTLFNGSGADEFYEKYFTRLPFASASSAKHLTSLFNETILSALFKNKSKNILFAKDGKVHSDLQCESIDQARGEMGAGRTLVVVRAEEAHPNFTDLAKSFENTFRSQAHVQLFWTPSQQEGFSWHYDLEDVFIFQTKGRKKFTLRKNSVYPLPVHINASLQSLYQSEASPMKFSCELEAGDWLYIPSGYWHKAMAMSDSMHISVAILPRTIEDIFTKLKANLLSDLRWRERLPDYAHTRTAASLQQQYRDLCQELGSQIKDTLGDDEFIRSLMDERI